MQSVEDVATMALEQVDGCDCCTRGGWQRVGDKKEKKVSFKIFDHLPEKVIYRNVVEDRDVEITNRFSILSSCDTNYEPRIRMLRLIRMAVRRGVYR